MLKQVRAENYCFVFYGGSYPHPGQPNSRANLATGSAITVDKPND